MDEQWAIVIIYNDGKSGNMIDSSLRFAEQKLAVRAVNKISENAASKNLKGMTVLGPFQVA